MALISELRVSSISLLIGFKVSKILSSHHSCNFFVINIFLSESKNSELIASAFGEKIFKPL